MNRPSEKALCRWYDEQPDGDRPCSDCGKVGPKHYVQPQHPFYAGGVEGRSLCGDCIAVKQREHAERRKAQLAARPKCEACGKRPQTWTVCGAQVCGPCKTRSLRALNKRAHGSGLGALGAMLYRPGKAEAIDAARGGELFPT